MLHHLCKPNTKRQNLIATKVANLSGTQLWSACPALGRPPPGLTAVYSFLYKEAKLRPQMLHPPPFEMCPPDNGKPAKVRRKQAPKGARE